MEFVYVVPREKLFPHCYPQGLVAFDGEAERLAFDQLVRQEGYFVERAYAERNPELKQIIPYTVFRVGDELLLMRRLRAGGESRLHDKLSIGVGGHINPEDLLAANPGDRLPGAVDGRSGDPRGSVDPILAGTRREIEEEIDVRGAYEVRSVGFLNDDSNPVGAVHVGVVQIADVQGTLDIREKDVLEGRLVSADRLRALKAQGEDFETWSSILIDRLAELVPIPQSVTS